MALWALHRRLSPRLDVAFSRDIIETARVASIPVSAFYATEADRRFVRFCFAKPDDMLDEAAGRLKRRFG